MNLSCLIGMILCSPLPEASEKSFLTNRHSAETLPATEILKALPANAGKEREDQILHLLKEGHWPASQSRFKPVQVIDRGHHLIYWVMADYLRLGSDVDSVLVPLAWPAVRDLAADWEMLLPTSKMVDQIYQQSDRIHWPHAYPPSDAMTYTTTFVDHGVWIQERQGFDLHDFPLVAGHKKDLVVSKRLLNAPKKLAIYGWHNIGSGTAIQPQSLWHADYYVDYSHGIRLVAPVAELDGKMVAFAKILKDPDLAPLISFEGAYDPCEVLRYECDKGPELGRR